MPKPIEWVLVRLINALATMIGWLANLVRWIKRRWADILYHFD